MWLRRISVHALLCTVLTGAISISGCGGNKAASITPPPVTPPPLVTPTASLSSPASVQAGAPALFDASASTSPTGSALNYGWDFGDGTHGGVAKLARAYATAGTYTMTLTVLDNAGHTASKTRSITVTAPPAPGPTVRAQGLVEDLANLPLAGVTATIVGSTASGSSDAEGHVAVSFATAADVLVKLSKSGYSDQFVPVHLPATAGADAYFETRLIPREAAQTLANAAQGGTLTGKNGAKLTLSAGSLVDTLGHAVTGSIQVSMTPVDVTSTAIVAFPGRFQGITETAATTAIVTYGTVEYQLTQNGQRLQLAPGKAATIEIPSFPNANADGSAIVAGDSVPLWSLDETTGLWIQEGVGAVVTSTASPTGLALRAVVGHFSWWNMDQPIDSSYQPKPKCVDAGSGTPGSTDHLANATICNMLAEFDGANGRAPASVGGGNGDKMAIQSAVRAAAAATVLKPGFGGRFSVPIVGGVAVRLPANQAMSLSANALNGTWLGHLTVSGAAAASPDVIIPMYPVASAPATQTITFPFGQSLALAANQTSLFSFTTDGTKPVGITLVSGTGSTFTGKARLLQGSTVLATVSISNLMSSLNSTLLAAGTYVIEVDNTGQLAATFTLQANYLHWASQGAPLAALSYGSVALAYDGQGRAVVMDAETYTASSGTNARLVFGKLIAGVWTTAAQTVELGVINDGALLGCIGFALDHNGNPAYVLKGVNTAPYTVNRWNGSTWQPVGPNNGTLQQGSGNGLCRSAPKLLFDANNQPFVAFDTFYNLYVLRFDGTAWQGLGSSSGLLTLATNGNPLYAYDMRLDSTGAPVLEWNTGGNTNSTHVAYVQRYVTTPSPGWVGVGPNGGILPPPTTVGDTAVYFYDSSLVLDANDRPFLAAGVSGLDAQNQSVFALAAFKFDGTQWAASDFHSAKSGGTVNDPVGSPYGVMLDGAGNLVVGWAESSTSSTGSPSYYVQTWSGAGATWLGLGSSTGLVDTPTTNLSTTFHLVKDPTGVPAVVFGEIADSSTVNRNVAVSVYVP